MLFRSSNRSLSQRRQALDGFKTGKFRVLVATDVAARGIDVNDISLVINYDLPDSIPDYVHRIGRTGRAGAKGIALSFASSKDRECLRRIEQFTGQKIPAHQIAGMEPSNKAAAKPQSWKFAPKRRPYSR